LGHKNHRPKLQETLSNRGGQTCLTLRPKGGAEECGLWNKKGFWGEKVTKKEDGRTFKRGGHLNGDARCPESKGGDRKFPIETVAPGGKIEKKNKYLSY